VQNRANSPTPWIGITGCTARGRYFTLDWIEYHQSQLLCSRRICPGIHVAERELWLATSRLLWAFDIRPPPGETISLEEYEGAAGRTPLPYRVMLTPRHNRVQALLEAENEVTLMKL
jgi:hypothetical protein